MKKHRLLIGNFDNVAEPCYALSCHDIRINEFPG